jgi:hypothetical protein
MAAFVLGNGISRQEVDVNQLMTLGPVYGCNALYRTHEVTALVATDHPISQAIQESGYSKRTRFYTRRPLPNLGAQQVPKEYFGYSSGPIAVGIAALDKNIKIYMIGFEMGPDKEKFNNVYAGTEFYKPVGALPTYTGNWAKQIARIARDHPNYQFVRVKGKTTADIADFADVKNMYNLDIATFLERINNRKDLLDGYL